MKKPNFAKFKKPNLVESNKSNLIKVKKLDFIKVKTVFFTLKTKEAFIYLWKIFAKTLIEKYFDSKHYILIEINTLGYFIDKILSSITLDQLFSNYVTYKNLDPNFSKSEIS